MYVSAQKDNANVSINSQSPKDNKNLEKSVHGIQSSETVKSSDPIKSAAFLHENSPLKENTQENKTTMLKKEILKDFLSLKAPIPEALLERALLLSKKHTLMARSTALALSLYANTQKANNEVEIIKTAKLFDFLMNTSKIDAESVQSSFLKLVSDSLPFENTASDFSQLNLQNLIPFLQKREKAKDFTASNLKKKKNGALFRLLPFAFREASVDFTGVIVLYLNDCISQEELCSVYFKANADAFSLYFSHSDIFLRATSLGFQKVETSVQRMKELCEALGFALHIVSSTDEDFVECNLYA